MDSLQDRHKQFVKTTKKTKNEDADVWPELEAREGPGHDGPEPPSARQ